MSLNSNWFSYSKRDKEFVAEASDLHGQWNAVHMKVDMISHKSGMLAVFAYSHTEMYGEGEDQEVGCWRYVVTSETVRRFPQLAGHKLCILND